MKTIFKLILYIVITTVIFWPLADLVFHQKDVYAFISYMVVLCIVGVQIINFIDRVLSLKKKEEEPLIKAIKDIREILEKLAINSLKP